MYGKCCYFCLDASYFVEPDRLYSLDGLGIGYIIDEED